MKKSGYKAIQGDYIGHRRHGFQPAKNVWEGKEETMWKHMQISDPGKTNNEGKGCSIQSREGNRALVGVLSEFLTLLIKWLRMKPQP